MVSKYINLKEKKDYEELSEAANAIREGRLILFPTETVYGIGANALDYDAVNRIFESKGRKSDNPLIVHIGELDDLSKFVKNVGIIEKKLIEKFWPGPLTVIFEKKEVIPDNVTAGLDTVGIRMPSNIIARELIKRSGVPIAAPSANISGKPSGTKIEDIIDELGGKVDYIIDNGLTLIGVESTVVRVIDNKVHILRPGKITAEDIASLGFEVIIEKHILGEIKENEKVLSPGMKYKHYAPNTKCVLIYSDDKTKLVSKINEVINETKNVLVLARTENLVCIKTENKLALGNSLEEISQSIFTMLRKVDSYNVDLVIIEGVKKDGLGLAIMNRLIRACSHNYIEI